MTPRDLTYANNNISTYNEADDDKGEECSLSDDESWTPSIGEEESDDNDDNQAEWKISQIKSKDFTVEFNVTDRYIKETYLQETKALTENLLAEFASISGTTVRKKSLNEDELSIHSFPSKLLSQYWRS